MMTTNGRIEADIKKNCAPQIEEFAMIEVRDTIASAILEQAQDCAGRRLTNLSTAGTKAGDAEMASAIHKIEKRMAERIVVELKNKYFLK